MTLTSMIGNQLTPLNNQQPSVSIENLEFALRMIYKENRFEQQSPLKFE